MAKKREKYNSYEKFLIFGLNCVINSLASRRHFGGAHDDSKRSIFFRFPMGLFQPMSMTNPIVSMILSGSRYHPERNHLEKFNG